VEENKIFSHRRAIFMYTCNEFNVGPT